MSAVSTPSYVPSMSDEAVKAKSGRSWPEWFSILDAAGCAQKTHKEIVSVLHNDHGVGSWWQQMITVEYERARGLRAVHQKCDGQFSANASRTLNVELPRLYGAWADESRRAKWLKEPLTIRKATENKSLRITMTDSTDLQVLFYAKGDSKSMVTIEHNKLADSDHVLRCKDYWKNMLDRMAAFLSETA